MEAWGTGMYQADIAEDMKETFKEKITYGKDGKKYEKEELIEEMIEEYRMEFEDKEERTTAVLVLTDLLWKEGILPEEIKKEALEIIDTKEDLKKWELNKKEYRKREKILEKFKAKLNGPMPEEKKRRIKKKPEPYICEWEVGDRIAYQLESEKAKEMGLGGKYLIVSILKKIKYGEDIIPVIRVQLTPDKMIPKTYKEMEECEYIITLNALNIKYEFTFIIEKKVKDRNRDKYEYIGNMPIKERLPNEVFSSYINMPLIFWGMIEEKILKEIEYHGTTKNTKLDLQSVDLKYCVGEKLRYEFFKRKYEKIFGSIKEKSDLSYIIKVYSATIEQNSHPLEGDEFQTQPGKEETIKAIEKVEKLKKEALDKNNKKQIEILEKIEKDLKEYEEDGYRILPWWIKEKQKKK